MLPFFKTSKGNASSLHKSGRFQRSAIEQARQKVADLVNANTDDVIFTSGGTEANNLAIKGFVEMGSNSLLMTSHIEHASLLQPVYQARQAGCVNCFFPVTGDGIIDQEAAEDFIDRNNADLISIQLANNETGAIQPVERLSAYARLKGNSVVHCDATQAIGKMVVDIQQLGVDLLTLSAHKFYGPQGIGALITRGRSVKTPLLSGGHQEQARRAGTESVALLTGMGKAAEIAQRNLLENRAHLLELREYFERQITTIAGVQIFSENTERLPNTSLFSIPYYHGETLLMELDRAGFELASGSACQSGATEPSHVLTAMGIDDDLALNSVRVSFGMDNERQQIDQLVSTLHELINRLPAIIRQVAVSGG